jgi:4-amino-4-deoxy-L-arabinose transferase-like glycosyltransferase
LWPVRAWSRFAAWSGTPQGGLVLLIGTTLVGRLLFAGALGLGIDESYMVAVGRHLAFGYYDHPPAAWWLAWGATHLFGSESPFVARLPFVLLFAGTTWLMFRLTCDLYGACAGLWAAALLNAAPVFGLTAASWVLPDGPLFASLLGAALCLARAQRSPAAAAMVWWLGCGACAGLALFSKYTAVLSVCGAVLFLGTQPQARHWLRRPEPYLAAALALAIFSPVVIWNLEHHWASLRFQLGRAGGGKWHPFGPLVSFAGEALFVLPWIWAALIWMGWRAWRRGPADPRGWMMLCLAAPPILAFAAVSLRNHVLFHWAAPGYLMLFPMLGDFVARRRSASRVLRVSLAATAALVASGAAVVGTEVWLNWLPAIGEHFALGTDPDIAALDWTGLAGDLRARHLLGRPGLVVAGKRWHDAGKLDYALGGQVPVICLGRDPRAYGLVNRARAPDGSDVLIISPRAGLAEITRDFGGHFASITALPPAMLRHDGTPAMSLPLFLGRDLRW